MTVVDVTRRTPFRRDGARGRANCCRADPRRPHDEAFPFATSRLIDLGYSTVRATRITYVGELGWELYVPTEFAVGVYETLLGGRRASTAWRTAGYYTINALRLEKGYRAFGAELTPDYEPRRGRAALRVQARHRDRRSSAARLSRRSGRRARAGGWSRWSSTTPTR